MKSFPTSGEGQTPSGHVLELDDGSIVSVAVQCRRISEIFGVLAQTSERGAAHQWLHMSDLLDLAGGAKGVAVDTVSLDPSVIMCSSAAEFQEHRSDLYEEIVLGLIRFLFIFTCVERLAQTLELPNPPSEVKARPSNVDPIVYLLTISDKLRPPRFYLTCLSQLREEIHGSLLSDLESQFRLRPWVQLPGLGLHVAKHIRDRWAHGKYRLPEPLVADDESRHLDDVVILRSCSRLVLLSIQMVLAQSIEESSFDADFIIPTGFPDPSPEFYAYAMTLHCTYDGDRESLDLFTD